MSSYYQWNTGSCFISFNPLFQFCRVARTWTKRESKRVLMRFTYYFTFDIFKYQSNNTKKEMYGRIKSFLVILSVATILSVMLAIMFLFRLVYIIILWLHPSNYLVWKTWCSGGSSLKESWHTNFFVSFLMSTRSAQETWRNLLSWDDIQGWTHSVCPVASTLNLNPWNLWYWYVSGL